jgi:hypothetical protein
MKKILLGATLIATFAATSAMAQGMFSRGTAERADRAARPAMNYTDSRFWSPVQDPRSATYNAETAAGASVAPPGIPAARGGVPQVWAPGATSAPYTRGDDIRNGSSALWGVGG